jgi:hypothetical protein
MVIAKIPNPEAQRALLVKECESWVNGMQTNGGAAFPEEIENYNAKCRNVTGEWGGGLAEDNNKCAQMSSEIDQARPILDQKQAEFNQRVYEYNKEWLPATSYTEQYNRNKIHWRMRGQRSRHT